jgi:membrane-associated phospholipid phosphatase
MKQIFLKRPLLLSAIYFPIYMLWFNWLQQRQLPRSWISASLDDLIPFCSWFVIPYVMWFFFVGGAIFWFRHQPEQCLRLCAFLFVGMSICLVIYTFFPNGQHLRPVSPPDNSILTQMVFLIYRLDPPINVSPSIHVFATLGVQDAIFRSPELKDKKLVRLSTAVLSVLIILATMFLKQHSIVDVAGAFLLAWFMDRLVYHHVSAQKPVPARLQKLVS